MKLMTARQAAKKAGVTVGRVYNAFYTGKLRMEQVDGKFMVSPEDLKAWRDNTVSRKDCLGTPPWEQETLNFKIDRSTGDMLRKLAKANRMSVSAYCRMAIRNQIEEGQKNG
jgi:hypothetical protein